MQVLVCKTPGTFEYQQREDPQPAPGQTILRIKRIGICGTDLHAFEGTQPYFEYPRILGHELAAEVCAADGAPGFSPGEQVTFIPYFACGRCIACRAGKENCCTDIKVCGVHMDGGMAEYLSVPSSSLVHSGGLSLEELALVEPLAIGAHGVRRAGVKAGETVLVVGAGPIGLGIMQFAGIAGATVIAMDVNEGRLAFCREKLGIPHTINPVKEPALESLATLTGGDMPEVVIDATGSQKAINQAFGYMSHGGRYVLVGLQKGDICFSHPEFHKREATLMSSRNATREDFLHVISCMQQGTVDAKTFITHRVGFPEVKDCFESWLSPSAGVIKAMVEI